MNSALSIAGLDPSSGAGLIADIKTFQAHSLYGMALCTALTVQTEASCTRVQWVDQELLSEQLHCLCSHYQISTVKIGLIESPDCVLELSQILKKQSPRCSIVWDPVMKASAGFVFHNGINRERMLAACAAVDLITPNAEEWDLLKGHLGESSIRERVVVCCTGVQREGVIRNYLYQKDREQVFEFPALPSVYEKHGSGCVFSASIAAQWRHGIELEEAVRAAGEYTRQFLKSSDSKLGFHAGECGLKETPAYG